MHKVYTKYKLILCVDLRPILGTTQYTYGKHPKIEKTKNLKIQNASDPKHFQRRNSAYRDIHLLQKHCVHEEIHSVVQLKGPAAEDLTATARKTDTRHRWQLPSQS